MVNGVFLPGCKNSTLSGTVHCGRHTNDYEKEVYNMLSSANSRDEVVAKLAEIRENLFYGRMVLNKRGVNP